MRVMSPRYAGVARAVTRCSVFVVFASSRGIELVVVGLGRLLGLVLISGVGPGVLWSEWVLVSV
jgi:hypothetical protein